MEFRSPPTPFWLLIALALAAAGCGGSPLSPSEVAEFNALTSVTESFSGTAGVGLTVTHTFVGAKAGAVTLTLTEVGPDAAALVGLGLGVWDGTNCTVQISTTAGKLNEVYQATTAGSGNFCVAVGDPGTFTADVTYTVKITHP